MLTLYQMQDSGNCYKIRLLAAHLKTNLKLVDVDILQGESRTSEFMMKNPNGRVPLLQDADLVIAVGASLAFHAGGGGQLWVFVHRDLHVR